MKRIGILGGSFNPIHNGHLEIASAALERAGLDEVWLVPAKAHAFDKELLDFADRLAMLESAVDGTKLKVCTIEQDLEGKSYMARTLRELKAKYPEDEFYFIIGADNIKDLDRWHDYAYLQKHASFIVAKRKGEQPQREDVKIAHVIDMDNPVSSTQIRRNIREKKPIKGLVPAIVEARILRESYYAR